MVSVEGEWDEDLIQTPCVLVFEKKTKNQQSYAHKWVLSSVIA